MICFDHLEPRYSVIIVRTARIEVQERGRDHSPHLLFDRWRNVSCCSGSYRRGSLFGFVRLFRFCWTM